MSHNYFIIHVYLLNSYSNKSIQRGSARFVEKSIAQSINKIDIPIIWQSSQNNYQYTLSYENKKIIACLQVNH